jgi:hypothetical protein
LAAGSLPAIFGDCERVVTPARGGVGAALSTGVFAGDLRGEVLRDVANATTAGGRVVEGAGKLDVLEADSGRTGRTVAVVVIGSENGATGTKLTGWCGCRVCRDG